MPTVKRIKRKRGGNAYQIGFYRQGERFWLSLPSFFNRDDANEVAANVARIIEAEKAERELDARTAAWIRRAPRIIRRKLEALELIERTERLTLGELVDEYERAETLRLKAITLQTKRASFKWLFLYFKESKDVSELTANETPGFVAFLSEKMANASRATVIRDVKRLFNWGKDAGKVETNPFESVTVGTYKNKTRERYVGADEYRKLLNACESQEMRALLALYRIGGLRLSEGLAIRREDVDLSARRLFVRSPKTARFCGKESRVVPLFAELYAELEPLCKDKLEGDLFKWTTYQARARFEKVRNKAGVESYPRPFQNMRSSRAIEIARDFGAVAESEWLGHSNDVARDHYLHTTEIDFANATAKTTTI